MTGFITPVSTAAPAGNGAVPPLLFPTFTAVTREQQNRAHPPGNAREIQSKIHHNSGRKKWTPGTADNSGGPAPIWSESPPGIAAG
jgi:hypothetical protein